MVEILKVADQGQIEVVAGLAGEIWREHFVPIVGQGQVDYMLEKFQSAAAIAEQIGQGYEYYVAVEEGKGVGYFAIAPGPEEGKGQLSKVYVRRERRGSGLGKRMLEFVEERCVEMGIDELWLTVNRNNAGPITFYERLGFEKVADLVMDIGGGFVMDDYKMFKRLGKQDD